MRRPSYTAVLLLATLAFAAIGWSKWRVAQQGLDSLRFTQQRNGFLEAETRRLQTLLADKQRVEDELAARTGRREIEATVSALRDLRFLDPVVYREIPRSDLPAVLRQKLTQQVPDQEFGRTSVALAALGLIPAGLDLKKTYLALLGEQVGAFYDQHSRELFTFSGRSLTDAQNRVILAHELTHALEDQHFQLKRLPLEAKGNDDRALAASALVEGDATLVMNRYMIGDMSTGALRETLASAMTTDVRQLAAAPRFLRESLLFPYLQGQVFCQELYAQGGWPALAQAFEHPPSCTSQILHPERFLAQPRDEPVAVDFAAAKVVLGQAPIVENVLGEFGMRQWLAHWLRDEKRAGAVAGGWHGDRYLVFGDASAASYVWKTAWKSPGEAGQFASAAISALGGATPGPDASANAPEARRTIEFAQRGRFLFVSLTEDGQGVLMINAQDTKWFDALKSRFGSKTGGAAAPPPAR